ncbi:MAG: penicillin-binding protein 2 [Alphaproteobacteria bacterium]|nr:penicillin-binding protein 2 [Alphaproteobacteria bacterium]
MKFNIGKDILPHEYKGSVFNRDSAERLRIVGVVFSVVFLCFIVRTIQLGLQHNDYGKFRSKNTEIERRADIVDRNGIVLAKSIETGNIKLYPPRVKDKDIDAVAQIVHEIAPMEYSIEDALAQIRSKKAGVYIKKRASEEQINRIKNVNSKYDCFEIEMFTMRQYPQRNIFAHVVGFAGKDKGLEGIEYVYDEYLQENKDALKLSIDSRVQNIFHEKLTVAMNKYRARGALGMLMNSTTGEMIAMVQLPDFNPNDINSIPVKSRRFKLLRDNFEMGSVFKIFNTALAYENGLQNKEYKVDEPLMIYDKFGRRALRKPIDDVSSFKRDVIKKKGLRKLKAPDIMLYSCNVGSARIALDLPDYAQKEFFHRLHLDRSLKLEFGKTENAITYKNWGPTEKATAGFGHGIAVTPMHLLLAVNAVTNGGFYIYPTLLKRSVGAVRGERVLDSVISENIRKIMFNIAEQTTAKKARVKGIEIGGKTGTAEKRGSDGRVDANRNVTVFTGVFPVSAPQYIIFVLLDEPQGTTESGGWKTAAWNAVPTAGAILDEIMPLLFE